MYKLLIVDDNLIQINTIRRYVDWASLGVGEIKTASDGIEGLELFLTFRPDIVITDIVMPRMDGLEMTRKIKEANLPVKLIFMSCYEDFEYAKTAIDNDVASYILKPVRPDDLRETALKVISEIEQERYYAEMDAKYQESLNLLRENFLYRVLYSDHMNASDMEETIRRLSFEQYRSFIVAKVKLFQAAADTETYLNIYNLRQFIKSFVLDTIEGDVIIESDDSLTVLLMDRSAEEDGLLERTLELFETFVTQASQTLSLKLCIGLSNPYASLSKAPLMLRQAAMALESVFSREPNRVYFYEEHTYEQLDCEISEIKSDLKLVLERSNPDGIEEFLQKYYPSGLYITKSSAKTLCSTVITVLQLLLLERNAEIKDLFGSSEIIWDKLERFETIHDARQWLKNMLLAACEFINDNEKNKQKKIISDIRNYIDQNYSAITSIEQVVAEMYISVGYAKALFKKYTGQTIFDYLINCRMEAAKTLLSDPDRKVYEVIEQIGYKSKAHFTDTFKRYVGMTPKEYQRQFLKNY